MSQVREHYANVCLGFDSEDIFGKKGLIVGGFVFVFKIVWMRL